MKLLILLDPDPVSKRARSKEEARFIYKRRNAPIFWPFQRGYDRAWCDKPDTPLVMRNGTIAFSPLDQFDQGLKVSEDGSSRLYAVNTLPESSNRRCSPVGST